MRTTGRQDDPHVKRTREWLVELRELCERHFDAPEAGRQAVREMQIEWRDAEALGELPDGLAEGLDRRAVFLTRAKDDEWTRWLDDIEFWRPGWRPGQGED